MERTCGTVRWNPTSTGPSVAWKEKRAEPGTVCCPILTNSQPSTNVQVSEKTNSMQVVANQILYLIKRKRNGDFYWLRKKLYPFPIC